jgi:hypothetical protein
MNPVQHDHRLCDLSRTYFAARATVTRVAGGCYYQCCIAEYRHVKAALDSARQALQDHEAGYTGWSRFYLVTSSSGHVHSSTHCCTCNKGRLPTSFALVPDLSGKTEAEAVAELGPALCSVCFPSAPAEHREQATVSQAQAKALADGGLEAFRVARQKAAGKASQRCPGAGKAPSKNVGYNHGKCSCCGHQFRLSQHGSLPNHNRPKYYVRRRNDSKCLGPNGWAPKTKSTVYGSRDEAAAVAVGFPEAEVVCLS